MGGCVSKCRGQDELRVSERTQKEMTVIDDEGEVKQIHREPDPYIEGLIEYVLAEWKLLDRDFKGKLNFTEILKLLKKLNVGMRPGLIKERFKRVDKDSNGMMDFKEFCEFLDHLRIRPEIKAIFDQFSHSKHYLTAEDLLLFLHQEQFEINADIKEALRVIRKYENSQVATKLYFSGFSAYMQADENSGYNYYHRSTVYQPMTLPMSMYYIASSHNTYIESHQLKGNSSVEAYISALKRGCKCVELDIWDGDDGQPIITHGHTMTSRIKFRDVVQAIRDHSFDVSTFPVILSLENHCTVQQQIRMAEIFTEILGTAGLLPNHLLDLPNPLPSPEDLENRILIKGKVLSQSPQPLEDDEIEEEEEDDLFHEYDDMGGQSMEMTQSLESLPIVLEGNGSGSARMRRKSQRYSKAMNVSDMADLGAFSLPSKSILPPLDTSPRIRSSRRYSRRIPPNMTGSGGYNAEKSPKLSSSAPTKVAVAKELSDLMHLKPVVFGGFNLAREKNAPWEMSSFSELKIQALFKFEAEGLVDYNITQFCRIYPKGTRFDSSNFPPMISWAGGCQMTSLNYQTDGVPMWLNAAKFLDNGGVGYVLKPPALRLSRDQRPPLENFAKTIHVHLISGWQLPKEPGSSNGTNGEVIDPYVKIKVYGAPGDNKKYKTKVIQNDGFNPAWDEHVSFEITRCDLAQVLFEVFDQDRMSKDNFLGYSSIPVNSIKQGYRTLQLYDSKSVPIPHASLFVQLMIT